MTVHADDTVRPTSGLHRFFRPVLQVLAILGRVLAFLVLAVYFPALIMAGVLVLMSSPGPAFVKRAYKRLDGEVVYLYEFRTECWRTWQETPAGSLLRRADLHRLPRLANVLMGDVTAGERLQPVSGA